MGKSTAQQDLILRMVNKFDLVICFVGSAACNKFLEHILTEHFDARFFFAEWDAALVEKLLRQQEELLRAGITREVLLLVDDVIIGSKGEEQLAHMGMRGRHFRISVMMCAVSYTTVPKRFRRSLDLLLVFSVPMRGDLQVLTYEFTQGSSRVARHVLANLQEHECLVLETLTRRQQLFVWKADLMELVDDEPVIARRKRESFPCEPQIASEETSEEAASPPHQRKMSDASDRSR